MAWVEHRDDYRSATAPALLDLLGDVRGLRILDLGCGDGSLAVELHKRGAIVTGIDRSSAMVEAARAAAQNQDSDIDLVAASAEAIPFPAARFDVVVAVTILCFVQDAAPVFAEIAWVLRPGGKLMIGELGKWSSWAAARRIRAWLGSPLWPVGPVPHCDGTAAIGTRGRSRSRTGSRCDLLSTLDAGGTIHGQPGSAHRRRDHVWRSLPRPFSR